LGAHTIPGMPYVIAEPCIDVKDGACVDVCPVDCIHTTDDSPMLYIDPSRCIDCRACELVCPVEAIFSNYDLPEKWASFEPLNAAFVAK
jgi:ferredoxin